MKEKIVVPKLSSRITAAIIMGVYIFVSSPAALIAQEIQVEKQKEELFFRTTDNDYILDKKEELITCSKGGTIKLGEASITIPEGALREDTRISIVHHTKTEETGESLYNTIPESGGYRFLPAGTKFEKDVEITLPYDPILNTKPQLLEDMYTYFYDTQLEQWIKLERLEVDQKNCVVKSLTNHFTEMINATLTLPESASPVDVNLNSIKNLEAAKPDSHLIKFNQPKASNFGDGSFSFELGIPSGRKGMQPQISVAYSSGNGNGIMGKGFDVNYGSSITTDTRFHLPYYSSDIAKKDTYMLDGIILDEISRSGNTIQYVPQKITSYQTIKRYNAYLENEYWIVTDKNGTKTYYGENYLSRSGKSGKVFTWNATRIVDVRGNRIDYEYEKDFYEPQIEVESDIKYNEYVYPSKISYTGYKNEKGNYSVEFVYDEEGIKREDVRIDARSGELVRCERLLTSIKTRYKENDPIRIYSFIYGESLGKVRRLNQLTVSNNAGESYSYGFAYEGLETDDEGNVKYFDVEKTWENPNKLPLSESFSKSIGMSTNLSSGLGVGIFGVDCRDTYGFTASGGSGTNYTKNTIIDIDGDGKCENIKFTGKEIKIYKQNLSGNGFLKDASYVINLSSYYEKNFLLNKETTNNSSTGWNTYAGVGDRTGALTAGYSYADVHQKGSNYSESGFYDMDGDGLLDIVLDTSTYLHNETSAQGKLEFSIKCIKGYPVAEQTKLEEDEITDYRRSYALQRPFRAWKAPYSGTIQLKSLYGNTKIYKGNEIISGNSITVVDKNCYLYSLPYFDENPNWETVEKEIKDELIISYKTIKPFYNETKTYKYFPEETVQSIDKDFSELYIKSASSYDYKLKESFTDLLDYEKRIALIKKGLFVPSVFTKTQFTKLVNYVKSIEPANDKVPFYERFAKGFNYEITTDCFYITEYIDREFFDIYIKGFIKSVDPEDFSNNISVAGINLDLIGEIPVFAESRHENLNNISRVDGAKYSTGAVYKRNGDLFIELGIIDNKQISLNKTKSLIYENNIPSYEYILVSCDENKIIISDRKGKYDIEFILNDCVLADSLTAEEYNEILLENLNDINHIANEIWNLSEEKQATKDVIVSNLQKANILDEQLQNDFINYMYTTVPKKNDEQEEEITIYINKESANSEEADAILIDAGIALVKKNNFSFIGSDLKIDSGNLEDTFIVKCFEKNNLKKYENIDVKIEYKKHGEYDVLNSKYYSIVSFKAEDKIDLIKKNVLIDYPVKDAYFSSKEDFSAQDYPENTSDLLCIFYEKNKDDESDLINTVNINSMDVLYGGLNNWFYGIWTGSDQEHPFDEKELYESAYSIEEINTNLSTNGMKKEDIKAVGKNKSDNLENQDVEKLKQQKEQNLKFSYYLPNISNGKLIGTVSTVIEEIIVGQDQSTHVERISIVSKPEISDSYVKCNRLGGKAYYKIEGIPEGLVASLPILQKSISDGNDITSGPVVSVMQISNSATTKNTGYGYMIQSLQDINGDRIPDVLMSCVASDNKKMCKVFLGRKTVEGNIEFLESPDFNIDEFYYLTKSFNSSESHGASFSALGFVQSAYNVKGIQKSISVTDGTSCASFTGDNYQLQGLTDINGDGIPDYITSGNVLLGTGGKYYSGFVYGHEYMSVGGTSGSSGSFSGSKGFSKDTMGQAQTPKNSASFSAGGGISTSNSYQTEMLLDINGDGLIDYVKKEEDEENICKYKVFYNTGSSIPKESSDYIEIPKWSVQGSVDYSLDTSLLNSGDVSNGKNQVSIPSYASSQVEDVDLYCNYLDYSATISGNINGSFGINVNIPFTMLGLEWNFTTNVGSGMNGGISSTTVSVRMLDLDGDGLSDYVMDFGSKGFLWKRNLMGKVDLLNKIILPQGGTVELTYEESSPTFDNPNFKYVMSSVTVKDGCSEKETTGTGYHSVTTEFKYSDGKYDRSKRDFYGYKTVKTIFADGSYQEDTYNNNEYYSKGTVADSCLYSSDQILLRKSVTSLLPSPYPLPEKEESYEYEKSSNNWSVNSSISYVYDEYLNVSDIKQFSGSEIQPYLSAHIVYQNMEAYHIYGLPVSITVKDSKNKVIRKRTGSYNATGELESLCQYWDSSHYSYNSLVYDEYGNIISVTDSRGASLIYEYGDVNTDVDHMFVTKITQKGSNTDSYDSTINYDMKHQTKTSETDCNGNVLTYNYDSWQRITEIRTSYDEGITPAVRYTYGKTETGRWYAITDNKVLFDKDDNSIIQTVLMTDGVGRAKWTAKTGCVNGEDGWNVSGAVEYDEKGRTIKEGMTSFFNGSLESLLIIDTAMTDLNTVYAYDEKDRPVKTVLPDKSIQTAEFYIEDEHLISVSTDPLGNKTLQKTDSRGNITAVEKYSKENKILTKASYEYDAMSQMIKALDSTENAVTVEYDILGRRTALESADSGRQEFLYDENSNLIAETSSVLREKSQQIRYVYDGLNRLIKIDYPETEDTVYVYGSKDDSDINAAGKILSVTDASGTINYVYGQLGEVIQEERTLYVHINGRPEPEKAVMKYRSDYLGRMQSITYPDEEEIIYGYDKGGQVISVKGSHYQKDDFIYVENILYDEYGQRTRIEYGNGTSTDYTYDPARRWLKNIYTVNQYNEVFQNIDYSFDTVGNVSAYTNNCLDSIKGTYSTTQTYKYDDLYQLIGVSGDTIYNPSNSISPEFTSHYTQNFMFDSEGLGNMTKKTSVENVTGKKSGGDNLNYDFDYEYDEDYAHRLVRSGNRYYKYDSNGNIICEQDGSFTDDSNYGRIVVEEAEGVYSTDYGWGLYTDNKPDYSKTRYRRNYVWNEKNLLIGSVDSRYSTSYVYGQDGQRSNKFTASSETLYFNKMWTVHTDRGVSSSGGQSAKNIYLGEVRIVTKLNSYRNPTKQEEAAKQYYYHSDHLGSASMITDNNGKEYERLEYTPYGELWVEHTTGSDVKYLPYKFTGKEMDEETGLYYYGARYLDPKYSRWLSTDPALGEYIPEMGKGNAKDSGNLPGMGGVYNHINFHLYHYAGNNPVRYTDPDGREEYDSTITEDQFNKISNGSVLSEGKFIRTLNGQTWNEVQQFFQQNPNGVIYRNPDERGYKFYSNQGKDKPCEYNMYTIDMLMFYAIGKETFHIGYVLTNAIKKKIAQKSVETVLLQMTQTTTIRHGVIQGFIKGDAKKTFQNLIKYATKLKSGAYQLADGSIINFHISSTTGISTIDINTLQGIFKIRFIK